MATRQGGRDEKKLSNFDLEIFLEKIAAPRLLAPWLWQPRAAIHGIGSALRTSSPADAEAVTPLRESPHRIMLVRRCSTDGAQNTASLQSDREFAYPALRSCGEVAVMPFFARVLGSDSVDPVFGATSSLKRPMNVRRTTDKTLLEQILDLPEEEQDEGIRALAQRIVDEGGAEDEFESVELILRNMVEMARWRAKLN